MNEKIYENCPNIKKSYPMCILCANDDDPEHFYVDMMCNYHPSATEPAHEQEGCATADQAEEVMMCVCTRRLTHQELRDFPYYFKDVILSSEGWERLDRVMNATT